MHCMVGMAQSDSTLQVVDSTVVDSNSVQTAENDSIEIAQVKQNKERARNSEDLTFIKYLISSELYDDAETALELLLEKQNLTADQRDSALFYRGWIKYFGQGFNEAIVDFEQVDSSASIFLPTVFHQSICYLYLDSVAKAKSLLEGLDVEDDLVTLAFLRYQLAGIALMERDYEAYDSLSAYFTGSHYQFSAQETEMAAYASDLRSFKRKSPFVAGLLSALLPGLGKFYVGYRGSPFGAFALTIPLMAIAIETAIIGGVTSIGFLIAAPIAAVFYVGNIWGSALSAYAFEREFYADMDYNIVYDVHIAMRRVFLK